MAAKKKESWSVIESNPFVDDFLDWMDSPDGQTAIDVMDELFPILETLALDAKARQIIWPDGQRLSINESVRAFTPIGPSFPPIGLRKMSSSGSKRTMLRSTTPRSNWMN